MEVKLDKRYALDAGAEAAWRVLSDVHAVAGCMPGAQITERIDATHYRGVVKSRVGPAAMTFSGDIEVLGVDAGERRIELLGKGSDRSGSSASMRLAARVEAAGAGSVLVGLATVTVSGKLAQFGGRLLVPVADAMLAQFADNFRAASALAPAASMQPEPEPLPSGDDGAGAPDRNDGAEAPRVEPPPGRLVEAPLGVPIATPPAGRRDTPADAAPVSAPAPPGNELNVLALAWAVARGWLAGLFAKKTA